MKTVGISYGNAVENVKYQNGKVVVSTVNVDHKLVEGEGSSSNRQTLPILLAYCCCWYRRTSSLLGGSPSMLSSTRISLAQVGWSLAFSAKGWVMLKAR